MRKQITLSTVIILLTTVCAGIILNSCPKPVEPVFLAPSNFTVVAISDSQIELSWTDNSDYEDGFKIERDSGSGFEQVAEVAADITEYTDSGLTVDLAYSYRVYAYAILKTSAYSGIANAIPQFIAPSNFTAEPVSKTEIELRWTDNYSYELGFKIERDSGSGFEPLVEVNTDETEYIDGGLTINAVYTYRIRAFSSV